MHFHYHVIVIIIQIVIITYKPANSQTNKQTVTE